MKGIELHRFARNNALNELEDAIARGANVNEKDEFGCTPLGYAVSENHPNVVALLLRHGADVAIQDNEGSTPLHSAVEHNLYHVAEDLLIKDAKVISISDKYGNEPLWTAVFNARGSYELVKLLLKYGADISHRNNAGLSPVDMAKRIGDDALLQVLESK